MGFLNAIGEFLGTDRSSDAIDAQTKGANEANATQKAIYDQERSDLSPYREAGTGALTKMEDPNFQKSFTMADFVADPGYQFRMQQGEKALQASSAAKGLNLSGSTLKALTDYGQNMGSQEYQSAYDRFNNDSNTKFSRLSTMAGYGLNAASMGNAAAQNYGNNVSANQTGLGNANAAANIASGNAAAGLINQGVKAGALFCDRRVKCDIVPATREEMAELRRELKPYWFNYKDPAKHGEGRFLGVMTEDLKKSKLGRTLVREEGGVEVIDINRTLMLFLAFQGEGA